VGNVHLTVLVTDVSVGQHPCVHVGVLHSMRDGGAIGLLGFGGVFH
jgi:hypothetical protein